jgi:hypothetical protein
VTVAWPDLPAPVRDAVKHRIGPVFGSEPVTQGANNDLAVVLRTVAGSVFVKGVRGESRRKQMLRNEIMAGSLAVGVAPEVLLAEQVGEWLIVGFRYVAGRPADLSPDSPDLPRVAEVVNQIGEFLAPDLRPLSDRWAKVNWWHRLASETPEAVDGWNVPGMAEWSARLPALVSGGQLAHTDLHGGQFVLGEDGSTHVVDWGFPGQGAPWVDSAFLTLRLFEAGHAPGDAEEWGRKSLAHLAEVSDDTLTAWAVHIAGMWGHWAATDPESSGKRHRAQLARDYAAWRLR